MRMLKWTVFFLVSFFVSWIVISTFSQSPFRVSVPVRILYYTTRDIPIYYFIASAFVLGLGIGLIIALYNYFVLKIQAGRSKRRIRELEENLVSARVSPQNDIGTESLMQQGTQSSRVTAREGAETGEQ